MGGTVNHLLSSSHEVFKGVSDRQAVVGRHHRQLFRQSQHKQTSLNFVARGHLQYEPGLAAQLRVESPKVVWGYSCLIS